MSCAVDMFSRLADPTMCFQHVFFSATRIRMFFFLNEILDACRQSDRVGHPSTHNEQKSKQKCSQKCCLKLFRKPEAKAAANGDHWWFVIDGLWSWKAADAADLMAGQPTTPPNVHPSEIRV